MNYFTLLFFLSITFFFSSCETQTNVKGFDVESNEASINGSNQTAEKMNPQEYVQWVQNSENGFKKEKTIDDLVFAVQYKPLEYIVCMEERKSELADSIVKKKVSELSDMQYFDLKIMIKNAQGELLKYNLNSQEQYDNRVKYFSFHMQQDIQLIDGNDTIPCSLFHFERAYDITPYSTFLLGFALSNNSKQEDKTLIVYDKTFNKGLLKFTFKQNELYNLPKIKTI